jgi:phosphosulfolactate synthase (CoM biosynthesis protein A)
MPYAIKKIGDKWLVVKADTGKKVAEHDSEEKAKKQLNLLKAIEHGWKPTKNKR